MLLPTRKMTPQEKRLLELFRSLSDADQKALLLFAEFVASRAEVPVPEPEQAATVPPPLHIPRPENESVIAAVKRLSKTYPMVEKEQLLHETSNLVSTHVLQGRPAPEVIDELERIFRDRYQQLFGSNDVAG